MALLQKISLTLYYVKKKESRTLPIQNESHFLLGVLLIGLSSIIFLFCFDDDHSSKSISSHHVKKRYTCTSLSHILVQYLSRKLC